MAFLTMCFNLGQLNGYTLGLLVVSIFSWEVSCAHFNMAITLAETLFQLEDYGQFKERLPSIIKLVCAQLLGAPFGILITFMVSDITFGIGDAKSINPTVPLLCPSALFGGCKVADGASRIDGVIYVNEFCASVVSIWAWIVVRNYKTQGALAQWTGILKPFIVYMIYAAALSTTIETSAGPANTNLALQLVVWSHGAYNYESDTQ